MKQLDFWFDYTCPFAYLGSTQARDVAERSGRQLVYKPLLLGGVFKAVGTAQNLFATRSAARMAHENADMHRWAKRFGVPLNMPPEHPRRSVEALRATLATGIDPKVVDGFFRAYWVDGKEVSSPETITSVVTAAGHDAKRVLADIETQAIKDDLRKRTEEAVALGIFGVPAWVKDGELYWGQDRIAFLEEKKPDPRPAAKKSQKILEVFWDFSSPFAYLATTQMKALAERTGATLVWKPMLLGGLFKSLGGPEVPLATFSAAKQKYIFDDIHRWAAYWGVPFKFPSTFPQNSLKALRIYLSLPESEKDAFMHRIMRAAWADDKDISKDDVLGPHTITDEAKLALRKNTEEAQARGVFGTPTFVVGDELFWGQDRLDLVEEALTR